MEQLHLERSMMSVPSSRPPSDTPKGAHGSPRDRPRIPSSVPSASCEGTMLAGRHRAALTSRRTASIQCASWEGVRWGSRRPARGNQARLHQLECPRGLYRCSDGRRSPVECSREGFRWICRHPVRVPSRPRLARERGRPPRRGEFHHVAPGRSLRAQSRRRRGLGRQLAGDATRNPHANDNSSPRISGETCCTRRLRYNISALQAGSGGADDKQDQGKSWYS